MFWLFPAADLIKLTEKFVTNLVLCFEKDFDEIVIIYFFPKVTVALFYPSSIKATHIYGLLPDFSILLFRPFLCSLSQQLSVNPARWCCQTFLVYRFSFW